MCLKNKWNNIGVKKKVFISSVGAIVVGFIILYLTLYFYAPSI